MESDAGRVCVVAGILAPIKKKGTDRDLQKRHDGALT